TVRAVVAQRLVRKLVPDAVEAYKPDEATLKRVQAAFSLPDAAAMMHVHELEKQAMKSRIGTAAAGDPSTTEQNIERLWRMKSNSSAGSSFRGRLGIYEVLDISPEIQKMIVSGSTSETLQNQAITEGMITMQTDGLIKSLRGQTTLEEVMRVTTER
ncbi:MAG: type II/IV secretion system protein, partial [Patescibacteria group bacterium]